MDWHAALRARLLAAAGVTDLVNTRVTWVTRPQTQALPAITLQTIDDRRPQHLKGFEGLMPATVQVDCWATTHAAASDLAEAVLAAAIVPHDGDGWRWGRAMVERKADFGEQTETGFIHRVSMDVMFHRAAA